MIRNWDSYSEYLNCMHELRLNDLQISARRDLADLKRRVFRCAFCPYSLAHGCTHLTHFTLAFSPTPKKPSRSLPTMPRHCAQSYPGTPIPSSKPSPTRRKR